MQRCLCKRNSSHLDNAVKKVMILVIDIEVVIISLLIFLMREILKIDSPSKSKKADELPAATISECNGRLVSDDSDDFNSNALMPPLIPLTILGPCQEFFHLLFEMTNA